MYSVSTYTSLSSLLFVCLNPSDPTLTVENIGPVMEMVEDWRQLAKDYRIFIPDAIQERITQHYTTGKEQSCAAGEWWVNLHPFPSWNRLAIALYYKGEDRALEKMAHYPKGVYMKRVLVLFTVVLIIYISISSAASVCLSVCLSEDSLSSHVLYSLVPGPLEVV